VSSRRAVVAIACLLFVACSPSHDRFENVAEVADALEDAGIPCDLTPDEARIGPEQDLPEGHSRGQCGTTAIYVLGDEDALTRIKSLESRNDDDTPRTYWVYGDNWYVVTDDRSAQKEVHDALGGEVTDNTQF
jgi:hypothetical protein